MTGRLRCLAPDQDRSTCSDGFCVTDLEGVEIRLGNQSVRTNATGAFTWNFDAPVQWLTNLDFKVVYEGYAGSSGLVTKLRITDEGNGSRTEALPLYQGGAVINGVYEMGNVVLSGNLDCEIFRISYPMLRTYHDLVGKSALYGELTIFRASDDAPPQLGPLAFFDDVFLPANFVETTRPTVMRRTNTLFHEFGHTIRDVADGDQQHWDGDNVSYTYAQFHFGQEINAPEYAFHEGWGQYWRLQLDGGHQPDGGLEFDDERSPAVNEPANVDWVENSIGNRLFALSTAVGNEGAKRMVEILERNPYRIHSMYEFEQAYCLIVPQPNAFCTVQGTPSRGSPPFCPVGYTLNGSTCNSPAGKHPDDESSVSKYERRLPWSYSSKSTVGWMGVDQWHHQLPIRVIPGSPLVVSLKGIDNVASGNPDLYVKFAGQPSISSADCISNGSTASEACVVQVPADRTLVYIGVFGRASSNFYELTVSNAMQPEAAFTYFGAAQPVFATTSIAASENRRYLPLKVNPGDRYKIATTGTGNVDLYAHFDQPPGTVVGSYSCGQFGPGSNHTCEGLVPKDVSTLHIMVRGTVASTYALFVSH